MLVVVVIRDKYDQNPTDVDCDGGDSAENAENAPYDNGGLELHTDTGCWTLTLLHLTQGQEEVRHCPPPHRN